MEGRIGQDHLGTLWPMSAVWPVTRVVHHRHRHRQHPGGAQSTHRLKAELKKYINPSLVLIDELGYLPIDKIAQTCFSKSSASGMKRFDHRHDQPAYKNWPKIFNNDSTLTSAVLDRLLHHAETVIVDGELQNEGSDRRALTFTDRRFR